MSYAILALLGFVCLLVSTSSAGSCHGDFCKGEIDMESFYSKLTFYGDIQLNGHIDLKYVPEGAASCKSGLRASIHSLDAEFDLLTTKPGSNSKILDLGSGMGFVSRYVATKFSAHVEAVNVVPLQNEYSVAMAKAWRVDHLVNVMEGNISKPLPFEDESFDVVIANAVFCTLTIAERHSVLQEINRVLKPKGQLLMTDFHPGSEDKKEAYLEFEEQWGGKDPYTPEEQRAVIVDAGFNQVEHVIHKPENIFSVDVEPNRFILEEVLLPEEVDYLVDLERAQTIVIKEGTMLWLFWIATKA